MVTYKQDDLNMSVSAKKCSFCGNEDNFLTADGRCQRCNYNITCGENVSKEEWDENNRKSWEEYERKVEDRRYVFRRRCSICNQYIEINNKDDPYMDKIEEFMREHFKSHEPLRATIIIEDITLDKIELKKAEK